MSEKRNRKRPLKILLAGPRGFCAGVDRAITIVEKAIQKWGKPVYVRHEIVHNRYVVESLENKGAIFVGELDEIDPTRPVIFSAHGVPKSVPSQATAKNIVYVDATCPLVSRIHRNIERYYQSGRHTILIGHKGHPEVVGTMGQLPEGSVTLVDTVDDVNALPDDLMDMPLSYATQTTLSIDDTESVMNALKERFPHIEGPSESDICYATTNRQGAVRSLTEKAQAIIVLGAPNSSNSRRLVDVGTTAGLKSILLQRAHDMDWDFLDDVDTLGITAGASAPEILIEEVVEACRERFEITVETVLFAEENMRFALPRELQSV